MNDIVIDLLIFCFIILWPIAIWISLTARDEEFAKDEEGLREKEGVKK